MTVTSIHPAATPRDTTASDAARGSRTAFVLSGGASLCALQVGMLHALYERGITPDLVVATSAGALNAAYLATRPPTVQTIDELTQVWCSIRRQDVFPIRPAAFIGALVRHRGHLVPDRALRQLISRHVRMEYLEQAALPLHLVSFDLLSGEEVRLSAGRAVEAVLAATAIPGILPPVRWGRRLLVDGAIVNGTPISHAVELGAQRIYVLRTDDPSCRALASPPRRAVDAAVHAFTLKVDARLQSDLAHYSSDAELIVLPATNPGHVQLTVFDQAPQLIAAGLHAARIALDAVPILHTSAA